MFHTPKPEQDTPSKICFIFQECKYEWIPENKSFQAIEFPTRHMLATYLNYKGHQDDDDVARVQKKFGPNK